MNSEIFHLLFPILSYAIGFILGFCARRIVFSIQCCEECSNRLLFRERKK
jgi:hypothetical protein